MPTEAEQEGHAKKCLPARVVITHFSLGAVESLRSAEYKGRQWRRSKAGETPCRGVTTTHPGCRGADRIRTRKLPPLT